MTGSVIWKGIINFGDWNIPVKLHPAVREKRIQFHLLHRRDQVRLRQQMICAYEDIPVAPESQARGFEAEEGKYIIVDPEELEGTLPENSRVVTVHEFVPSGQIEPLFLDHSYLLESDALASHYETLRVTLQELDATGICTWAMRKRPYFGALQAGGSKLRLTVLRYADEVIPLASLELQDYSLSEKELKIGSELIRQLTSAFEPWRFENEHQKKLENLIAVKARGEHVELPPLRLLRPTAPDKLLQALEASLKNVA